MASAVSWICRSARLRSMADWLMALGGTMVGLLLAGVSDCANGIEVHTGICR